MKLLKILTSIFLISIFLPFIEAIDSNLMPIVLLNFSAENVKSLVEYDTRNDTFEIMHAVEVPVHQYIAWHAKSIWTKSEINTYIPSSYNPDVNNYLDGAEDDILEGTYMEDKETGVISGCPPNDNPYCDHFWDADIPQNGEYNKGIKDCLDNQYGSAYKRAETIYSESKSEYEIGNKAKAYYLLGRIAHLITDMTVPAHVHLDPHPDIPLGICGGDDAFEDFMKKEGYSGWSDVTGENNFKHFIGSDYVNQQYNYEDVYFLSSVKTNPTNLFKLFWYTAQKTQYFASDDWDAIEDDSILGVYNNYLAYENGDLYYFPGDETNTYLWGSEGGASIIVNDKDDIEDRGCGGLCDLDEGLNLAKISEANIPHAMKAVAGLYRLFWAETHNLQPCTSGSCCDTSLGLTKESGDQPTGLSDEYVCSGINSPTDTNYVKFRDYYCTGTSATEVYTDTTVDTCGVCEYCLEGSSSCLNHETITSCNLNYACSFGTGDNYYDIGGENSCLGFCDGSGSCDYADACLYDSDCDPDDDDDGILDVADVCPNEPGLIEYDGCPYPYFVNVTITHPLNYSTLITNSTWLNVTTDNNAFCTYSQGFCFTIRSGPLSVEEYEISEGPPNGSGGGGGGGCGGHNPINMSTTGGKVHSQLVTSLKETTNNATYREWNTLSVNCTDVYNNSNRDYVNFYVNISNCIHDADTDCDDCVNMNELLTYIGLWKADPVGVGMNNLLSAIGIWKSNPTCT